MSFFFANFATNIVFLYVIQILLETKKAVL